MPVSRLAISWLACALAWLPAVDAGAEAYRLQVANLYLDSFSHFIDGPIGTGAGELRMSGLQRALDSGTINAGAVISGRAPLYGWDDLNRSLGAVKVRATITPSESGRGWDEAVWDGKPGERSVFVIAPSATSYQQVCQVALNGTGDNSTLRYYIPYQVTGNPTPQVAVSYPLVFLRFYTDRGNLWNPYLSKSVSLADGLAAVVGVNDNPSFADWVYLIVEQPAKPTVFKAVVSWERRRSADRSNFDGASGIWR